MSPLLGLLQLLSIGFLLYLLALIVYTAYSLLHPHRNTYASALARNLPGDPSELDEPLSFEDLQLTIQGRSIALWDIQGRRPDGPVVLMTHGWGSSRQGALKRLGPIAREASRVIVWDLPGHGDSEGISLMGSGEHQMICKIIEQMLDPQTPVVLFGWSMGAGITLRAATERSGCGMVVGAICESPYALASTPARNVIRLRGIPHRLNLRPAMCLVGLRIGAGMFWRGFDRVAIARGCDVPLLILHGQRDPVCPIEDARRIAQAAPECQLRVIEGGGHNNLWVDPQMRSEMSEAITSSLRELATLRSRDAVPARP